MKKYEVTVIAYQSVEVEAESEEEAIEKAIEIGIDTGSAEWDAKDVFEIDEDE